MKTQTTEAERERKGSGMHNPATTPKPYEYRAKLDRIIDGDTYRLHIDLGFDLTLTESVRLAGVNCPERGTLDGYPTTIAAAEWWQKANHAALIRVTRYKGKYGRIIAEIHANDKNLPTLAEWLLQRGCKPYKER